MWLLGADRGTCGGGGISDLLRNVIDNEDDGGDDVEEGDSDGDS